MSSTETRVDDAQKIKNVCSYLDACVSISKDVYSYLCKEQIHRFQYQDIGCFV